MMDAATERLGSSRNPFKKRAQTERRIYPTQNHLQNSHDAGPRLDKIMYLCLIRAGGPEGQWKLAGGVSHRIAATPLTAP
jgi:hypothetical protein